VVGDEPCNEDRSNPEREADARSGREAGESWSIASTEGVIPMTIHQSPTVPRRAALAVATLIASLAAVAGAVVGASPASADGGYPCRVLEKSGDKVIGQVYYQDGDVIETEAGPITCVDGTFEGPNVDSPLPGQTGGPQDVAA